MTEKYARLSVGIIIAIMLMNVVLVFMPKDVLGQKPQYGVTVEVSGDKEKIVDVRPGYPGTTYFEFIITDDGSGHTYEDVDITAVVQAGWQCAPSKSHITLTPGQSMTIAAFVTANRNEIAPFTTYCQLEAVVTGGTGGPPAVPTSDSATTSINIEQYSLIMFDAETPYEKVGPKQDNTFVFKVTNIGNGQDQFRFDIANFEDLEGKDWTLVRPDDIVIQPGKKETILLSVRTPKGWGWKDEVATIQIIAKSKLDPKYTEDSFITLWVRGISTPGFDPMFTIIAIGSIAVLVRKKYD